MLDIAVAIVIVGVADDDIVLGVEIGILGGGVFERGGRVTVSIDTGISGLTGWTSLSIPLLLRPLFTISAKFLPPSSWTVVDKGN